tara:strand:- start:2433 stop:3566 length:1134 start_codon:yes stop_codon:yes gene_type:complete
MIKWLLKYGVVIFVFNSILLSIESTYVIGNQIFLALMGIFLFVLLINPMLIKTILFHKAFSFLLFINLLNLLYFFLFHSISDYDAIKYLMARSVEFSIISTSIFFNYEYYKNKFLDHLVYVVLGIVVFGFVIDPSLFSGRYSGIIWNPNMFSSLVIIAFSIHFLKHEKLTRSDYFILFILLISALASGSRNSLVALILVFIFKYGFTSKNVMYGFFALVISLFILTINLETSINRFVDNTFNDRILQFEYAYISVQEKLFTGYGLDKYAYINKSLVPIHLKDKIIGAHNGYLAILAQYGIIFGSVILFLIFRKSLQAYFYFKNKKSFESVYLFIILYVLIASIYESLITGINEFSTILFWFSTSILSYSMFLKENES